MTLIYNITFFISFYIINENANLHHLTVTWKTANSTPVFSKPARSAYAGESSPMKWSDEPSYQRIIGAFSVSRSDKESPTQKKCLVPLTVKVILTLTANIYLLIAIFSKECLYFFFNVYNLRLDLTAQLRSLSAYPSYL